MLAGSWPWQRHFGLSTSKPQRSQIRPIFATVLLSKRRFIIINQSCFTPFCFDLQFCHVCFVMIDDADDDGVILIPRAKKFVANFLPIDLAYKNFLTFSEI